ncbi:MAG: hypothetical protein AAGG68_11230 [Bacteroidota bacterium]
MKNLFVAYPRLTFILLGIYALEQCCYFYASQAYTNLAFVDVSFFGIDYLPVQLLEGGMVVFGGYLASRISDQKKGLLWGLSLLLLGHLLTLLGSAYLALLGYIVITLGSSIFILIIYIHNAILYPVANDFKDNSFMFFFFTTSIAVGIITIGIDSIIGIPVYEGYEPIDSVSILLGAVILFGIAFLTIYNTKQIGYNVEEEEKELEPTDYKPFLIFLVVANILTLAYSVFPKIGDEDLDFWNYSIEYNQIIALGMLAIMLILPFLLMQTSKHHSRHYPKMQILIIGLVAAMILEFSIRTTLSYEMNTFTHNLFTILYIFLLSPILFSILTHLHFDKKGIIMLGILIGSIQITISLANYFYNYYKTTIIVVTGLLLIALFIWLRENKDFILDYLALDEPNQEIEEEENDDDLLNHLIG